jgi:mannosyltransferase
MWRVTLLALGGLTLAGLALRVEGVDQSLFGDELFTYYVTEADGPGGVLDRMEDVESNPPLFYVLAWFAGQVGDPAVWLRAPSLVLGTAAIPAVYALGSRLAGRAPGLLAAALVALSPFAIFFATEARAYAALTLFVALSTLALREALEGGRREWWVAFWLASTAAIYTHYTAIFVLAAQAAWALWAYRARARELLVVHGAIAFAYLPWLPSVRSNVGVEAIAGSYELTAGTALTALLRLPWGHPLESLDALPGTAALAALAVGTAAAAAGVGRSLRSLRERPSEHAVLLAALVAATPLGLLVYDLLGGDDLYAPRNLSASLPALAVAVGAIVYAASRPIALTAGALLLTASAVGIARLLQDEYSRPALREVAHEIDARARPGDRVVDSPLFFVATSQLQRGLEIQFEERHPLYRLDGVTRTARGAVGVADPRAWRGLRRGQRVFVAGYEAPGAFSLPGPPGERRFRVVSREIFEGLTPVTLVVYEAR